MGSPGDAQHRLGRPPGWGCNMDGPTRFRCRYVQDWTYVKALDRHIGRTSRKIRGFFWLWVVLLVLCVVLMLDSGPFRAVYAVMAVYSAYRAFFHRAVMLRVSWNRTRRQKGTDRIETAVEFGESIIVTDDSGASVNLPWSTLKEIRDSGDYFELLNGVARSVYAPKAGFEDGTGQAFWSWIGQERPEIKRTGKK